jgi:Beta-lactamase enzyme family
MGLIIVPVGEIAEILPTEERIVLHRSARPTATERIRDLLGQVQAGTRRGVANSEGAGVGAGAERIEAQKEVESVIRRLTHRVGLRLGRGGEREMTPDVEASAESSAEQPSAEEQAGEQAAAEAPAAGTAEAMPAEEPAPEEPAADEWPAEPAGGAVPACGGAGARRAGCGRVARRAGRRGGACGGAGARRAGCGGGARRASGRGQLVAYAGVGGSGSGARVEPGAGARARSSLGTAGALDLGDDVGLCRADSRDAVDRRQHGLREGLLVGDLDEREDVRLPPARMALLHATQAAEGRDDFLVLPGLDGDEDVGRNDRALLCRVLRESVYVWLFTRVAVLGLLALSSAGPVRPIAAHGAPAGAGRPEASAGEPGPAAPRREPVLPTARAFAGASAFARGRAGLVSFAVVDTSGELRCHQCWRRYTAASVVKAMLLVAYLDSLSSARRPLTSADRALLGSMIRVSDNEAATAVYLRVGDAGLQRLARRAGMKAFAVSGYWGYAQITAADQARLFARLNGLVPRKFLAYARGLLSSIVSWQSWGIPEVARPHWRTFFKGGWRGSARGQLVHQVARLERGRLSLAIAVLTDGNPSHAYGRGTVRGIAAHLVRNGRRP